MRATEHDTLVYRAAREAIRNAQAHAGAASIGVAVTRPEPDGTRLVVTDDGTGFEAGARRRAAPRATSG